MTSKRGKRKTISWKHRCLLQKVDWLGKLGQEHDTLSHLNNILNTSRAPEVTSCSVMSAAKRSQPPLGAPWKMEEMMSSALILPCLCPLQDCFIYHLCLFSESIAVFALRWRTAFLPDWGLQLPMYMGATYMYNKTAVAQLLLVRARSWKLVSRTSDTLIKCCQNLGKTWNRLHLGH